jgi:chemotaxis protein methyltransferase CheR
VLCRNVLIYQKDDRKKEIIVNIGRAITPKGYFVMGAAESLFGLSDAFTQVAQDGAIFFQKKAA